MCLFRFKIWWSIPRVGNSASDIPIETQMLLVEAKPEFDDASKSYFLFLPLLDGDFRCSLQGNSTHELLVCVESGIIIIIKIIVLMVSPMFVCVYIYILLFCFDYLN